MPDPLPQMTYKEESPGAIVRAGLADAARSGFPAGALSIPPHTTTQVLLDRKTLTTAYPELTFSGGRGSRVVLTYAEALYDAQLKKGNRNDVADRHAIGFHDVVLPDGGEKHTFEPLWWRTWRYLQMDIETGDEGLTLEHLGAHESTYPFEQRALFDSGDADLQRIWEIGWRTARLDAHETYMDTPYYEQLQYIGDTRIQALISYAVAGDDRLARQAIAAFANSHIPEGLTQSRYPSNLQQIIPPFSLYWIGMLDDLYWYRPDAQMVTENLQGTRDVLAWFFGYLQPDGLLSEPPYWNFVDWVPESATIPTFDKHGESCVLSLEMAGALRDASELERAFGNPAIATSYERSLQHMRGGIYARCWSPERKLLADTPDRTLFSEHANILGVLYDVIPKADQQDVLRRIVHDQGAPDAGQLLLPLLSGAGAGACRTGRSVSLVTGAVARAAADGLQHLAGDAGRYPLRLARVECASDVRFADHCRRDSSRKPGLPHGEDRSGAWRFEKAHRALSAPAGRDHRAVRIDRAWFARRDYSAAGPARHL